MAARGQIREGKDGTGSNRCPINARDARADRRAEVGVRFPYCGVGCGQLFFTGWQLISIEGRSESQSARGTLSKGAASFNYSPTMPGDEMNIARRARKNGRNSIDRAHHDMLAIAFGNRASAHLVHKRTGSHQSHDRDLPSWRGPARYRRELSYPKLFTSAWGWSAYQPGADMT